MAARTSHGRNCKCKQRIAAIPRCNQLCVGYMAVGVCFLQRGRDRAPKKKLDSLLWCSVRIGGLPAPVSHDKPVQIVSVGNANAGGSGSQEKAGDIFHGEEFLE